MEIKQDNRPWGKEEIFTTNEQSTVKILTINPRSRCSLQFHHHRSEFWKVIEGSLRVQIRDEIKNANLGDEFTIPAETNHRMIGTDAPAKILEISTGIFDENDIVRLEDDYGRIK
jgi:mannose-1-phosphate guanylyltransferase